MKNSKIVKSVCLFSSVFILGACSNSDDQETIGSGNHATQGEEGTPAWQEEEIDLVFASRYYGEENSENPMWLNIEKFMEKYPNVNVIRDAQFANGENGNFEQLEMLNARAQDNDLPDIYFSPMSAEVYDREFTLDLTPYLEADDEAQWISENAMEFLRTHDGEEIYGLAWQSVSQYVLVNTRLLRENNIAIPDYNWSYEEYENLRSEIAVLTPNSPIFPGVVGFGEIGPNYFDDIPNGWKGFNIETERWDLASATNFGEYYERFAREAIEGLHFYDLSEEERVAKVGNLSWAFGDGLQVLDSGWLWALSGDVSELIETRDMEIDIYPMPTAPRGETYIPGYYDTFSISSQLEDDPVKAQAAFELLKWLTYGEEGLLSRWALIDEYTGLPEDAPLRAEDRLMDFIQGWPITTNPTVLANHPLVKGFDEESGLANYNFAAFKEEAFQQQLSNPVAYPRQMPGFSNVQGDVDPWEIMHQIKDEGVRYSDIASEWDRRINEQLEEYLRQYNR